jgi:hypothetical protein
MLIAVVRTCKLAVQPVLAVFCPVRLALSKGQK